MKKILGLCLFGFVMVLSIPVFSVPPIQARLQSEILADREIPPSLQQWLINHLLHECTNPVFVKYIELQNAECLSLRAILDLDKKWRASEVVIPEMRAALTNPVAKEIKRITSMHEQLQESFVMDNQGALVGVNNITSDYMQGDEPIWKKSYKNGQGAVYVAPEQRDISSRMVVRQISMPIFNAAGKVVGAVTWGVQVKDFK